MNEDFFELYHVLMSDRPKKAEAMIWLQGDRYNRGQKVVELYKKKLARRVVVSGNNILIGPNARSGENNISLSDMKTFLLKKGVNKKDIIVDDNALNTKDQATHIINLANKRKWNNVILVGSAYHQPRIWLTFVKAATLLNFKGKIFNHPFLDDSFKKSGLKNNLKANPMVTKEMGKIKKYQLKNDLVSYADGFSYLRHNRNIKGAIKFRKASFEDAALLLDWRNDFQTRKSSHHSEKVNKSNHVKWLKNSLSDPNRKIFIAEYYRIPVGTVRADYSEGFTELSWTVAPEARGRGIGKEMVAKFADKINGSVRAEVKKNNEASKKIAESAGMKLEREDNGILYYQKIYNNSI
jgi:RimJ/RimL family protein N-acetyltransferase